ncbi:hypothetical protein ACET3Z_022797 [Daucus carota]
MNASHSMQGPQAPRAVQEDAIVLQFDRLLDGQGKPRLRWTKELHDRFLGAVFELGDFFSVKAKDVLRKMNVEGLTIDHIRSHLQVIRASDCCFNSSSSINWSEEQFWSKSSENDDETLNEEGQSKHSTLMRCRERTKRSKSQGNQKSVNSHSPQLSGEGSSASRTRSTAPVLNGEGLETTQAQVAGYGNFPQSSQAPNYHQNPVSAHMGDDGDESVLVPNYFLERLGYNGGNANNPNFGF